MKKWPETICSKLVSRLFVMRSTHFFWLKSTAHSDSTLKGGNRTVYSLLKQIYKETVTLSGKCKVR
jgi:hypothetical protein